MTKLQPITPDRIMDALVDSIRVEEMIKENDKALERVKENRKKIREILKKHTLK